MSKHLTTLAVLAIAAASIVACTPPPPDQEIEFRVPVFVREVGTDTVEDRIVATGSLRGNDMVFIVAGFILFNTMMNAGPNLSTYTIPSEVFPVRLRASGHGLATGCGKVGATAGVLFFPIVQDHLGLMATLGIVAIFAVAGAAVTFLFQVKPDDGSAD